MRDASPDRRPFQWSLVRLLRFLLKHGVKEPVTPMTHMRNARRKFVSAVGVDDHTPPSRMATLAKHMRSVPDLRASRRDLLGEPGDPMFHNQCADAGDHDMRSNEQRREQHEIHPGKMHGFSPILPKQQEPVVWLQRLKKRSLSGMSAGDAGVFVHLLPIALMPSNVKDATSHITNHSR